MVCIHRYGFGAATTVTVSYTIGTESLGYRGADQDHKLRSDNLYQVVGTVYIVLRGQL